METSTFDAGMIHGYDGRVRRGAFEGCGIGREREEKCVSILEVERSRRGDGGDRRWVVVEPPLYSV